MGLTYSFLEAERKTWIEHSLSYDHSVRAANLYILNGIEDGKMFYLSFTDNKWGRISFEHWFFSDGTHFIELGSQNQDIYAACVTISTKSKYEFDTGDKTFKTLMNQEIRNRIKLVLGMSNYSLCLRNCEHVANFIARGRWVSHQMDTNNGPLMNYFKKHLLQDRLRLVNSFPSNIRPHVFNDQEERKIYSFIKGHFKATQFSYYLDNNEDTHNILIVGPTGAGKTHLINVMFNQKICETAVSHHSVTREIYFIRGSGQVYDEKTNTVVQKNIVVADTIGLCDTAWLDEKILELIKGRVSTNIRHLDLVIIAFKADRLPSQHVMNIKKILEWINYSKNFRRVCFVSTYSEHLSSEQKEQLRKEASKLLEIKNNGVKYNEFDTMIFAGFPPEEALNDMIKARCIQSYKELQLQFLHHRQCPRINVEKGGQACSIL